MINESVSTVLCDSEIDSLFATVPLFAQREASTHLRHQWNALQSGQLTSKDLPLVFHQMLKVFV